jgi:hypothetical protein
VESTTLGFGGDLKVLVGFSPDGTILGYTILQHAETPGLGAKAQAWFQKDGKASIIGMSLAKGHLAVSKDGGQVDAITASTITSRAFLKAINQAYAAYTRHDVEGVSGASHQIRKELIMNNLKIITNGLVKENPTFVLLLGMCPTLATTTVPSTVCRGSGHHGRAHLYQHRDIVHQEHHPRPGAHPRVYRGHRSLRHHPADVHVGLCPR